MTTPLVLALVLAVAALLGAAYYVAQDREAPEGAVTGDEMTEKDGDAMMEKDDGSMTEGDGDSMAQPGAGDSGPAPVPFVPEGNLISGSVSPLIDFNQADYDRAVADGRVVLLYFYANWCPICRDEVPRLYDAFKDLTNPRIVGFRVNYNDNETDDDEKELARKYGIAYQHTKVIIKGGVQVLKNGEAWSKDRYLAELADAVK